MNATDTSQIDWTVTLRTGPSTWSTITVPAPNHEKAIASAQRLLGDFPATSVA
jgi:hypothetical protein